MFQGCQGLGGWLSGVQTVGEGRRCWIGAEHRRPPVNEVSALPATSASIDSVLGDLSVISASIFIASRVWAPFFPSGDNDGVVSFIVGFPSCIGESSDPVELEDSLVCAAEGVVAGEWRQRLEWVTLKLRATDI